MRKTTSNQKTNNQKQSPIYIDIKSIINDGGETLNKNGDAVQFSRGYQVSKKDCYIIKATKLNDIQKAIYTLLKAIDKSDFIGVWIDNGLAYIDISERIKSVKKALAIGRARHQQSIFEWSSGLCLYI